MPARRGFYKGKKPCVDLLVAGTRGHPEQLTVTVDTGFTGFLLISQQQAEPHGLQPIGTTMATLANGSQTAMIMALTTVGFGDRSREGVATISNMDCQCLIGIDFLRLFELALVLTDKSIWLAPAAELESIPQFIQAGKIP